MAEKQSYRAFEYGARADNFVGLHEVTLDEHGKVAHIEYEAAFEAATVEELWKLIDEGVAEAKAAAVQPYPFDEFGV